MMVAALAVLAAGCEPDEHVGYVAFSPDGDKVAYTVDRTIYVHSRSEGRLLGEIDKGHVVEARFDWTPDGSAIVFTSDRHGPYNLARASAPGFAVERLTDGLARDGEPRVVLGGAAVAFVSSRDGQADLYLLTLADKTVARLTNDRIVESSLSADREGGTLAFLSTNEAGDRWISLVRLPDVERRMNLFLEPQLTAGDDPIGAVQLSGNGAWVAFNSPVGVCLFDVERARRRLAADPEKPVLTDGLISNTTRQSDFAFSPDSRRLAYVSGGKVYTKGLAFLVGGGRVSDAEATDDRRPAWSPDGAQLAVAAPHTQVEVRSRRSGRHVNWLLREPMQAIGAAQLAASRGEPRQAVALLEPLAAAPDASESLVRALGSALLAAGRPEDALELYRRLHDQFEVGRVLIAQRRFDEAQDSFQSAALQGGSSAAKEPALMWRETVAQLDDRGRRTLADLAAADLRGDPQETVRCAARFLRDQTAAATDLGAYYAYYRTELLERLAGKESGRARRRAFEDLVKVGRQTLKDYPKADSETRFALIGRIKSAYLYELDDKPNAVEAQEALLALVEQQMTAGKEHDDETDNLYANLLTELISLDLDCEWLKEADRAVRRAAAWAFKEDARAVQFCAEVGAAFDAHRRFVEGTAALERLVKAYRLEPGQLLPVAARWVPVALAEGTIAGMDLSQAPTWMKERVRRVLQAAHAGPMQDLLLDGANVLFGTTHDLRLASWQQFMQRWRDRSETAEHRAARMAADCVLGDGALAAGQTDAALDYYLDLARLSGRDNYARALEEYKSLLTAHAALVAEWLSAEQRTRVLYLPSAAAEEVAGRLLDPAAKMSPAERATAVRRAWADIYQSFLVKAQEGRPTFRRGGDVPALQDNFLYRAAEVVDPYRAEWFFRTLLCDYPESEFAAEAFEHLASRYEAGGNYYLACTLGAALLPKLTVPADQSAASFRVGGLYANRLQRPDLARPFMEDVASKHAEAAEWPAAQFWLARDDVASQHYDRAAEKLDRLILKAPKAPMVQSGEALFDLGQALRRAGQAAAADAAFVKLVTTCRDHAAVKDPAGLAAIWTGLGDAARATLVQQVPDDVKRLYPHLSPEEQTAFKTRFPLLAAQRALPPTTRPATGTGAEP
jgi:hypothetical protein